MGLVFAEIQLRNPSKTDLQLIKVMEYFLKLPE